MDFLQRNNFIGIVQMLVIVMFLCGSAEAKGIEAGLGKMAWDMDTKQVKECLKGQGFELIEEGKDPDGRNFQRFGNSQFSSFYSNIHTVWQSKQLAEINIESSGVFLLGAEFTYRNLVAQFTDEYGQPVNQDKYMLKIFPGIWVETTTWLVDDNGIPSFGVTVVQENSAEPIETKSSHLSKISIHFKNIDFDLP